MREISREIAAAAVTARARALAGCDKRAAFALLTVLAYGIPRGG
jgi:hypothetical protein